MSDKRLITPVCLLAAGVIAYLFLNLFLLSSDYPRVITQFLSHFCIILGAAWLYMEASDKPKMKILDWCLVALTVFMMSCFEILGLPLIFWTCMVLAPCVAARLIITLWLQKKRSMA